MEAAATAGIPETLFSKQSVIGLIQEKHLGAHIWDYLDGQSRFQAQLLIPCGNKLGECPLWDDTRCVLSWIDIQGKALWQYDPRGAVEDCRSFTLPSRPGSFCIAQSGEYLLALEDGLYFFDPSTEDLRRIPQDFVPKGCRLNDGRVDLEGRFVVSGTVEKGEEPLAAVYRLNTDCSVEKLLDKVRCGNSICFSDNGSMFFADPAFHSEHGDVAGETGGANCIWQFPDYQTTGLSGPSRIFVDAGKSRPDGSIIDAEGGLWNAEFGAGRVVRYLPDGSVSMVVKVPVRYTTCAAFGGEDMQTLYITDATVFAHQRMSKKCREELPEGYAGGLFSVRLPVKGLPERKFAGAWQGEKKRSCCCTDWAGNSREDEQDGLHLQLADLQMQLVDSAWSALRPGGVLVYSTCTLNSIENEEVCEYVLQKDAEPLRTQELAGLCGPSFQEQLREASQVVLPGAMLLRRLQTMSCIFRGRRSTLEVSMFILRGRGSTLDMSCCVFLANRIVRAASSGDNVQIKWQAWDIVSVSFGVAGAAFGADPSCVECHFVWQAQYSVQLQLTTDVEVGSQGIPVLESGRNLAEESSKTRRLRDSLTVVTFYTEGPPQDDCLPLTHVVEELRKLLKPQGGEVQLLSYTPRSLAEDDFYRKHCCPYRSESGIAGMEPYMELLPHAHKLGYYAWKPLVICKALSQVEPGSMLLFVDANLQKYQDYREGLQDLRKTCRKLLERTDFFVPLEDPMWKRIQNHCKALTLELMDANTFTVAFAPCICVNRILMRRTALVERLMQDWLHWCGQSDVICPIPNPKPHPLCLFHTPEQAILAILVWPQSFDTEGFFLAAFRKLGKSSAAPKRESFATSQETLELVQSMWPQLGRYQDRLVQQDSAIVLMPDCHRLPAELCNLAEVIGIPVLQKDANQVSLTDEALLLLGPKGMHSDHIADPTWWLNLSSRLEGNLGSFNAQLDARAEMGDVAGAEDLMDYICQQRLSPDLITYTTLIKAYGRDSSQLSAQRAVKTLTSAHQDGLRLDAAVFATVLYALARAKDLEGCESLLQSIESYEVVPDSACYTSVIHAATAAGRLQQAEHWLNQAEASERSADVACYAAVLNAYARAALPDAAEPFDSYLSISSYRSSRSGRHPVPTMATEEWRQQWIEAVAKIRSDVSYDESAQQLRSLQQTGLLKLTDLKYNPAKFFEAHRLLARHAPNLGPGFWIRFTVHYNLFAGSVLAVGNEDQVKQLDEIQQKGLLGCFGLTEKLAGVNSGGVVNTIAEWDDQTQEFVLTSHEVGAQKNWISQGLVGELGVVVADLRVAGKRCGAHAFLMELRTANGPVPNVEFGDMGRKTVGNDLDNAWIAFHGARVPRHALLSRYGEVQPGNGGSYVSKVKGLTNMAMIGQRLFSGRVAVAWAAITFTRKLFEMTRKYSDQKKCWVPKNSNLTQVPQLQHLYTRAEETLQKLEAFVASCEKQLSDCLQKDEIPPVALQEAIASAKILASETSIDLCFRLKQDVGSHALMGDTGFEQMDFLQACKFAEGDSRILMQKLARDRVRVTTPLGSSEEQQLTKELQEAMKGGAKAWDANFEKVYDLAWLVVQRNVASMCPGTSVRLPCGLSKL
eukprot:s1290_g4.t1